jgi:hypothetical protein
MTDPLMLLLLAACCRIAVRAADAAIYVWTLQARARLETTACPPAGTAHPELTARSQR